MKKSLALIALLFAATHLLPAQHLSAMNPAETDTLRGTCLVLMPGGVMTLDTATNRLQMTTDAEGLVAPLRCICVETPIELVPPDLRGDQVGWVREFFDVATGQKLDANDILIFKIRNYK